MLKEFIRRTARALGYDIRRFAPATSHDAQFGMLLSRHGVDLVFDVGANNGQFSSDLRKRMGYRGRIISFEPMAKAHAALIEAARGDALWEIAPRMAIGAKRGSTVLNVSQNSVSSSILPMLGAHSTAAPESRYVGREVVAVDSLDNAAMCFLHEGNRGFIKIDTQGYETEVLRGAEALLSKCVGVQLELSLVPLYEGQQLMLELWGELDRLGFDLWAMSPVFVEPQIGRLLQVDATFFRRI